MIYKIGNVNNEINTDNVTSGLQRRVPFESLRCTSLSTTPLCLPNVSNICLILNKFGFSGQIFRKAPICRVGAALGHAEP
jgi:hypothetical protein